MRVLTAEVAECCFYAPHFFMVFSTCLFGFLLLLLHEYCTLTHSAVAKESFSVVGACNQCAHDVFPPETLPPGRQLGHPAVRSAHIVVTGTF
jgi:hypothetical protein